MNAVFLVSFDRASNLCILTLDRICGEWCVNELSLSRCHNSRRNFEQNKIIKKQERGRERKGKKLDLIHHFVIPIEATRRLFF